MLQEAELTLALLGPLETDEEKEARENRSRSVVLRFGSRFI